MNIPKASALGMIDRTEFTSTAADMNTDADCKTLIYLIMPISPING